MMVYVLKALDNDAEYVEMDEIIGVFSSKEKAEIVMNGKAKEIFNNYDFSIEEWELDDFSWELVK